MEAPVHNPQADSIPDLFANLVEDGRAVARSEINLYKQIALHRAARARNGLIALAAGGVLLWFAFMALIFGLVLGIADLIGPVASGVVLAVALGAAGYFLLRTGLQGMSALSGDEEERQALARGESL